MDLYILVVCGRANLNLIKSAAEPQELRGHVMTTDFSKSETGANECWFPELSSLHQAAMALAF